MRHKTILLALVCLLLAACGSGELDWSGEKAVREFSFQMVEPQLDELVLRNTGQDPVALSFQVNGGFFADVESMVEYVRNMKAAMPNEPEVRKAWRFVSGLTINSTPLNESKRMHHPLLLLNSAGVGYCDDEASALTMIWKQMGYQTRVWKLGGHIVPEVQIGGKWQVYDPSMKVYYTDDGQNAVDVETLQSHPELVLSGITSPPPLYISTLGLSTATRDIYASRDDNVIDPWYDSIPPVENGSGRAVPGEFRLPPGGVLRLSSSGHGYFLEGLPLPGHAFLDLELPAGYVGRQPFPLLVLQIDGKMEAEYAEKLQKRELFLDEMEFDGKNGPLRIRCALNPAMVQFKRQNTLLMKASHPENLDLEIVPLQGEDLHLRKEVLRIRRAVTDEKARYAPFQDSLPPVQTPDDLRRNAGMLFRSAGETSSDSLKGKIERAVEILSRAFEGRDAEGQATIWRVFSEGHIFVHAYCMMKNMAGFRPYEE